MKIYCKDCKYCGSVNYHTCHHPKAKKVKVKEYDGAYEHHREEKVTWKDMNKFNRKNNCKIFKKRSWWQC